MTDPGLADATYIEPITPAIVAKILERERPDALLPTMGGQTGLNTALDLWHDGVLERLGVELGAKADAIAKAEDRQLFREAMESIGLDVPGRLIHDMDEAQMAIEEIGLPQFCDRLLRLVAQAVASRTTGKLIWRSPRAACVPRRPRKSSLRNRCWAEGVRDGSRPRQRG